MGRKCFLQSSPNALRIPRETESPERQHIIDQIKTLRFPIVGLISSVLNALMNRESRRGPSDDWGCGSGAALAAEADARRMSSKLRGQDCCLQRLLDSTRHGECPKMLFNAKLFLDLLEGYALGFGHNEHPNSCPRATA